MTHAWHQIRDIGKNSKDPQGPDLIATFIKVAFPWQKSLTVRLIYGYRL